MKRPIWVVVLHLRSLPLLGHVLQGERVERELLPQQLRVHPRRVDDVHPRHRLRVVDRVADPIERGRVVDGVALRVQDHADHRPLLST